MMKKLLSMVIVAAFAMSAAPALAQQTTVNSPQSTNNGISNPVGQNTNVQVNNSYAGMNSFGVGIECATPYLAAGLYNNNTNVNDGGLGASNNAGSNNSLGGTLQYVVPIGGRQQANCTALSNEIVHQHQLDTQITLIQRCTDFAKAGVTLDSKVYPEIAAACAGIHVTPGAASTSMVPTPQIQTVTVPKLVVYKEPAAQSPTACGDGYRAPTPRDKRLLAAWRDSLHHKLSAAGAKMAAEYMRELQSDCVNPIAMTQGLGNR